MGREAGHRCGAYLDFCGLAVGVSGADAVCERLGAAHPCLDPASNLASGPALPECPAGVPGGTQGFVSGDRGGAVLFSRTPVPADRDDRGNLAVDDRRRAAAGVICPICGHRSDLFALLDLVEQLRWNPSPVRSNRWRSPARCRHRCPGRTPQRMSEVAVSMARWTNGLRPKRCAGCRSRLTASQCATRVVSKHKLKERASLGEVSINGVDLAKNVAQLHGAASDGSVVIRLCERLAGSLGD